MNNSALYLDSRFWAYDAIPLILEWGPAIALSIYIGWKITYSLLKNTKLKRFSITIISIPVIGSIFYFVFLQVQM
ncbi:MAG: hypothetical protein KAS07_02050 [Candidatus Pacebacteria bacterium]|nr:hypothetical protein [Candidatus Paceibacterota bacterium]